MSVNPQPPTIRELFPVIFGNQGNHITDFAPHPTPVDAKVVERVVPKAGVGVVLSEQVTTHPQEAPENPEPSLLEQEDQETEKTPPTPVPVPPVPSAAATSHPSSLPTGLNPKKS